MNFHFHSYCSEEKKKPMNKNELFCNGITPIKPNAIPTFPKQKSVKFHLNNTEIFQVNIMSCAIFFKLCQFRIIPFDVKEFHKNDVFFLLSKQGDYLFNFEYLINVGFEGELIECKQSNGWIQKQLSGITTTNTCFPIQMIDSHFNFSIDLNELWFFINFYHHFIFHNTFELK